MLVDGELVLYETAAICLHLADTHPKAGLAPPHGTAARAHYYKWLVWCTNTLQAMLMHYFYPQRLVDDGDANAAAQVKSHAEARIGEMLDQLDAELGRHAQDWLLRLSVQQRRSVRVDARSLDARLRSPGPQPAAPWAVSAARAVAACGAARVRYGESAAAARVIFTRRWCGGHGPLSPRGYKLRRSTTRLALPSERSIACGCITRTAAVTPIRSLIR